MKIVSRKTAVKNGSHIEEIKRQVIDAISSLEPSPDKSMCGWIECKDINLFRAYLLRYTKDYNRIMDTDRKYKTQKDPEGVGYIIWRTR